MNRPNTIAIDGPAASGKSTAGEMLALRLGYLFFDTGILYRAVTLAALQQLHAVGDEQRVDRLAEEVQIDVRKPSLEDGRKVDVYLDGVDVTWDIRTPTVEADVSQVSAYPGVRLAMIDQQRRIGRRGQVVMIGRDIGTVVLPDADLKVYLDASAEERARRRYAENIKRGIDTPYEEILRSIRNRDTIDSTRAVAPLKPADDAVIVNTDGMTIDEVVDRLYALVESYGVSG